MVDLSPDMGSFSFETSSSGEHFNQTAEFVKELREEAAKFGRKYTWLGLALDYDIPEISQVDYRYCCPLIYTKMLEGSCIAFYVLPDEQGSNGELVAMPAVQVDLWEGDSIEEKEICQYAKAVAYFRFALRDGRRENDMEFWNSLIAHNIVSHNVVPLFQEDLERARDWASEVFPGNLTLATMGKLGEFAVKSWADERKLPFSKLDLEVRNEPDHYDFLYHLPFGQKAWKIDVKTYWGTPDKKKRKHWNISESCLHGNYAKDIFMFVVMEEEFRYATIVGMMFAKDVEKKGKFVLSDYAERGYYEVYEKDLLNPHYVRAAFDQFSMFLHGNGFGHSAAKTLEEMIKDYPLDPVLAHELGYPDPYTPRRGGLHNLCCFATKRSVIPLSTPVNDNFLEDWMSQNY